MHWMDWFGGGGIMMVFWWGLVIAVIYLVVKTIGGQKSNSLNGESALDILKKQYARGEISKKEFEEKKADIT